MTLLESLDTNPFVLAPMAGITDSAFRSFMREMGAGVVISELVSAHGIEYKGQNTLRLTKFNTSQRPVGIQLFGEDPESVARAAQYVETLGCDFIDLNFGCPVPKVVKKGAGSAMLKDPALLGKMLNAVKRAIHIPLTIKIRTGWDQDNRNAIEITNIAYNEGVTWVAIHGRTRAQGYSGLADWDFIGEVAAKSLIPIIGNGDIHNSQDAVDKIKSYGCRGVMIGRGALKNPWIFSDSNALFKGNTISAESRDFPTAFAKLRWHLEQEASDRVLQIQLKKFAAWFSAGYPGASNLRKSLFRAATLEELNLIIENYFLGLKNIEQQDTRHEAFLMGGHG